MVVTDDARLTLVRGGLADASLEGVVAAREYRRTQPMCAIVPAAALRGRPDAKAELASQLLFGEGFEVLETEAGFALGQAIRDGYVGWVNQADLGEPAAPPTHWVSVLRTFAFAEPSIKSPAAGPFGLNALVTVTDRVGALAHAEGAGWIAASHLSPVGAVLMDPTKVALAHLGVPYLWGGRDSAGLDCSGLVQQALLACGIGCPRDSDQQQALGVPAPPDALARGDLVFWKGHVGMMLDPRRLIHANAHHMAVSVEPLRGVLRRIADAAVGQPTAFRRPVAR